MQDIVQDLDQAKEVAYAMISKDVEALGVEIFSGLHGISLFFLGDHLCTSNTIIIIS